MHISLFHDATRIKDLEYFCNAIIPAIRPQLVVATGDLTDAKNKDLTGSTQFENEWKTYNRIVADSNILTYAKWLDIRGNHGNFHHDYEFD